MNSENAACVLRNLCIFQGVQPPDYLNCRPFTPPCVLPYNRDGTFICQYHLSKYFKIKKMVLKISDGVTADFDMLIGKTLIQQNTDEARRIMIPTKQNYIQYLRVDNMTATEKFVFYTIYEEPEKIRDLCLGLRDQEYYTEDVLRNLQSVVGQIMGQIEPALYCRPEFVSEYRNFNNPPDLGTQQQVYDNFPPFLRNLIRLLVRAQVMTVNKETLNLEQVPTCDIVEGKGLIANNLYNPTKPDFTANPYRESKFQVRNVMQFGGRATKYQEGLSGYEVYKLDRPLFLGTENIPN